MRQPLLSIEQLLAALELNELAYLLQEERVIESIESASPAMGELLRSSRQASPEIAETLLKYVLRMSTRCTPFGLFAGGAVGYIAQTSTFDFRQRQFEPRRRLDSEALVNLAFALTVHPAVEENICFYSNRTVCQIGDRLRYTERSWQDGQWRYFASEVPAHPAILSVLDRAKLGATLPELAQAVAGDEPLASATQFIRQLIEDSLLLSELIPAPTGNDALATLIHKLTVRSAPVDLLRPLQQIQTLLAKPITFSRWTKLRQC